MPLIQIPGDIVLNRGAAFNEQFPKPGLHPRRHFEPNVDQLAQMRIVTFAKRIVLERAHKFFRTPGSNFCRRRKLILIDIDHGKIGFAQLVPTQRGFR